MPHPYSRRAARCESVYEFHTRVVNLSPFIIHPRRASGSLSFPWRDEPRARFYGGWSATKHSDAPRGVVHAGNGGEQLTRRVKAKATVYVRARIWPTTGRRLSRYALARKKLATFSFSPSSLLCDHRPRHSRVPGIVSIISHPLSYTAQRYRGHASSTSPQSENRAR